MEKHILVCFIGKNAINLAKSIDIPEACFLDERLSLEDNISILKSRRLNLCVLSLDDLRIDEVMAYIRLCITSESMTHIMAFSGSGAKCSIAVDSLQKNHEEQALIESLLTVIHSTDVGSVSSHAMKKNADFDGRNKAMRQILFGITNQDFDRLKELYSLNLCPKNFQILLSYPNSYDDYCRQADYYEIYELIKIKTLLDLESIFSFCPGVEIFMLAPQIICVLVNRPECNSQKTEREMMSSAFTRCRAILKGSSLYISKVACDAEDIFVKYTELREARRYRMFFKEFGVMTTMLPYTIGRQADSAALNECLDAISSFSVDTTENELEQWLRDLFISTIKPASDLDAFFLASSMINSVIRKFCMQYYIPIPSELSTPLLDYKRLWIEDICSQYIDILNDIRRQATQKIKSNHIAFYKIVQYIETHYSDPNLNLTSCSSVFNISKSSICHAFSQNAGISFTSYVNNFRIQKAIPFLCQEGYSIQKIAAAVGFSDPKYFSRVFKSVTGLSPKKYSAKDF